MERIAVLALGMFALGLDAYVVAGLVPGIGASFGITPGEAGQAVTVFTLTYALAAPVCTTLLAGRRSGRSWRWRSHASPSPTR